MDLVVGRIIRFMGDGEYLSPPLDLEGCLVHDEDHGWVLEFVLPISGDGAAEAALFIPLDELKKIASLSLRFQMSTTRQ